MIIIYVAPFAYFVGKVYCAIPRANKNVPLHFLLFHFGQEVLLFIRLCCLLLNLAKVSIKLLTINYSVIRCSLKMIFYSFICLFFPIWKILFGIVISWRYHFCLSSVFNFKRTPSARRNICYVFWSLIIDWRLEKREKWEKNSEFPLKFIWLIFYLCPIFIF